MGCSLWLVNFVLWAGVICVFQEFVAGLVVGLSVGFLSV